MTLKLGWLLTDSTKTRFRFLNLSLFTKISCSCSPSLVAPTVAVFPPLICADAAVVGPRAMAYFSSAKLKKRKSLQ